MSNAPFQMAKIMRTLLAVALWVVFSAGALAAHPLESRFTIQDAYLDSGCLTVLLSRKEPSTDGSGSDPATTSMGKVWFGVGVLQIDPDVNGAQIRPIGTAAYPKDSFHTYPFLNSALIWTNAFAVEKVDGFDVHHLDSNGKSRITSRSEQLRVVRTASRSLVALCGSNTVVFREGQMTSDKGALDFGSWCGQFFGKDRITFSPPFVWERGQRWARRKPLSMHQTDIEFGSVEAPMPRFSVRMPTGIRPVQVYEDDREFRVLGTDLGKSGEGEAVLYNRACEELFRVKPGGFVIGDEQVKNLVSILKDDRWFVPEDGKVTARLVDLEARRERTFGIDFNPLIQQMEERK